MEIKKAHMKPTSYYAGPTNKHWIILHHTAGHDDPLATIKAWDSDNRGRVGTQYVIGGLNAATGKGKFDGAICEAFPQQGYAWHTGTGSSALHLHSIGIELCNIAYSINGESYVGSKVLRSQEVMLNKAFRGHQYWHRYSDKQLQSLKKLLLQLAHVHNIDLHKGLYEWVKKLGADGFDVCNLQYANSTPGLYTHANLVRSKSDVFPQPELVDLILSL